MQLKPLNDPLEIKDYILRSTSGFCDFSLGFLLMWKKSYNFYYAIENDTLILGGGYDDEPFAYFYPIGKDVEGALKLIEEDSAARAGCALPVWTTRRPPPSATAFRTCALPPTGVGATISTTPRT